MFVTVCYLIDYKCILSMIYREGKSNGYKLIQINLAIYTVVLRL